MLDLHNASLWHRLQFDRSPLSIFCRCGHGSTCSSKLVLQLLSYRLYAYDVKSAQLACHIAR